jgi:hypothetical protein
MPGNFVLYEYLPVYFGDGELRQESGEEFAGGSQIGKAMGHL